MMELIEFVTVFFILFNAFELILNILIIGNMLYATLPVNLKTVYFEKERRCLYHNSYFLVVW